MLPNIRRLLVIYRRARGQYILSQALILIASVFTLLIPTQISRLVNEGVLTANRDVIIDAGLNMLLFAFLAGVCTMANLVFAAGFAEGTANYVRSHAFRALQRFSFGNLDRLPTGELLVRLTSDVYQIKLAVNAAVRSLLQAPFQIVVAIILVWLSSPRLIWILFAMMILVAGVLMVYLGRVRPLFKARQMRLDALNNVLQEDFAGIRVVKAFERQAYENERYDRLNDEYRRAALAPMTIQAFVLPALFATLGLSLAATAWFGGVSVISGSGTNVGELIALSQYLLIIMTPMGLLAVVLPLIASAEASAGRLLELVDTVPTVADRPAAAPPDAATLKGRVVFEDVGFSYDEGGTTYSIRHINLVAEPGQTVAILGATGAGKSTLVNLVPRFYDVSEGRITIDGVDVRDIPQEQLRQIVGIALQEAILFSGTVGWNLKWGHPEATDDQMIEAARAADADSFVANIPGGYASGVARRGTNFSGGQRQRLSIARAITARPTILILDDSTSAVDVATESRIQAAMSTLLAGTTTLIVAQRISTVLLADSIVLLDGGEMVAVGSHRELMATSPLYREIFESQLGGLTT